LPEVELLETVIRGRHLPPQIRDGVPVKLLRVALMILLPAIVFGVAPGDLARTQWTATLMSDTGAVSTATIRIRHCRVDGTGFVRCRGRFSCCVGPACPARRGFFLRFRFIDEPAGIDSLAFEISRRDRSCDLLVSADSPDAGPFTGTYSCAIVGGSGHEPPGVSGYDDGVFAVTRAGH
jgi:hypothetical protein